MPSVTGAVPVGNRFSTRSGATRAGVLKGVLIMDKEERPEDQSEEKPVDLIQAKRLAATVIYIEKETGKKITSISFESWGMMIVNFSDD